MKKKLLILLACFSVLAFGAACAKSGDKSNGNKGVGYGEIVNAGGTGSSQTDSLAFEDDALDLIVGDETALKLGYASSANASPVFTSSDPAVASVDAEGIVSALQEGTVTITATLGNLTDAVSVRVSYGTYLPTATFLNAFSETDDLRISTADTVDFSTVVRFNSKSFFDAQVTYQCTGDGTMDGNVFTPTKAGEATVKINVVWRGFDVYLPRNEFTVKIVHDVQLYVNDSDVCELELYTKETLTTEVVAKNFVHTLPFVLRGSVDGQALASGEIEGELTEGADFVSIANNEITGVKQGRAIYTLRYDDGETVYEKTIPVEVKVSTADYNTTPIRFSALDGKLETESWKTLFGDETIVEATIGSTSLTVTGEGVTGLKVKATDKRTTQTLTVRTDTVGYNFQVVPYTMILKTPQDFDVFTIKEAVVATNGGKIESATCFDGYYILGNDITWDDSTHWVDPDKKLEKANSVQVHKDGGLTGIFDGEGHTVTGMKVANMGIFGMVCGGTVRNVGFEKLEIVKDAYYNASALWGGKSKSGIAYSILDGVFENVYIHAEKLEATRGNNTDAGGNRALIANILMGTTRFKNCIFKLDEMDNIGTAESTANQYTHSFGSFVNYDMRTVDSNMNWDGAAAKIYDRADWTGVYVISPVPLAVYKPGASKIDFFMDDSTHAENTIKDYDGATKTATVIKRYDSASKTYVDCTGIVRYDDEEAFKAAENDYSGFKSAYWDVSSGVPVWKQK